MVRLLIKTNPGVEDLALEECRGLLRECRPLEIREGQGRLYVEAGRLDTWVLEQARLFNSVTEMLLREKMECNGRDECIKKVREAVELVEWGDHLLPGESFAVRAERVGEFPLTSPEIAAVVGSVVEERVRGARVHLGIPHRVFVAEVDWGHLTLGVQLAGEPSLHRRWYRVREHVASLKPTLAQAMLVLSGVRDGQSLVDPMCGSGTIPIEALLYHEWLDAVCSDRSWRSVEAARVNSLAAGTLGRLTLIRSDVRSLAWGLRPPIDHVVTNPPYGLRVGDPRAAHRALGDLFDFSSRMLDDEGRLTLLFPRRGEVEELAGERGFGVVHARRVRHGDLDLWLLVLGRGS